MPRELTAHKVNGCNEALNVEVLDEPGKGGACHEYRVTYQTPGGPCKGEPSHTYINFQNGPIPEVGTNGVTHEALLAIIIDRLQGFQSGQFACEANRLALESLELAMVHLRGRTLARLARGVEGTHAV